MSEEEEQKTPESIYQDLRGYQGNHNILMAGQPYQYTQHELSEFVKCAGDIHYFIKTYMKIVHPDKGLVPFELYPYQKNIIDKLVSDRFVIGKLPRQSGKTTTTVAYLLHYALFNSNVKVAILAHRAITARELFNKIRLAYEHLPKFLQAGIAPGGWNKGSITLGNGSSIKADSTSSGSIRGETFNCISGDGKVQLIMDDVEFEITLNDFFNMANSSRKKNINNDVIIWKDLDERIFTEQIYKMVFSDNREEKKSSDIKRSISNRKPSHNTNLPWRDKLTEKFGSVAYSRTFNSSSSSSKNGRREIAEDEIVFCISQNGGWETGQASSTIPRKEANIYEEFFDDEFHEKNWMSSNRRNEGKNSSNVVKESGRGLYATETFGLETLERNKGKNFKGQSREGSFRRDQGENIQKEYGKTSGNIETNRVWRKNFQDDDRYEEIDRTHGKNKQESRKDQKNRRQAPWYEKIRGIQNQNVLGPHGKGSLEQRIKIKTTSGWETFRGIQRTKSVPTVKLFFNNGYKIECTEEHLFQTESGWIKAIDLMNHSVISEFKNIKLINIEPSIIQDVFDILHTEKTNSFFVNGISVHNCIFLDEFAFVPKNLAEEFIRSVYPTISAGKTSKVIIFSTPKGTNHFYEMWEEAVQGKSGFTAIEIQWDEVPGRDEDWKKQQISQIGRRAWNQEFECVTGETLVTVRNSLTGIIEEITIEELYHILESYKT